MRFIPVGVALALTFGSALILLQSTHDASDVLTGTLWVVFSLAVTGFLVSLIHLGSRRLGPLPRRWLRFGSILGTLPTLFYWLRLVPGLEALTEWPGRVIAVTLGLSGYLVPLLWDRTFTLFHEHASMAAMLRNWCVFTGLNVLGWGALCLMAVTLRTRLSAQGA